MSGPGCFLGKWLFTLTERGGSITIDTIRNIKLGQFNFVINDPYHEFVIKYTNGPYAGVKSS